MDKLVILIIVICRVWVNFYIYINKLEKYLIFWYYIKSNKNYILEK